MRYQPSPSARVNVVTSIGRDQLEDWPSRRWEIPVENLPDAPLRPPEPPPVLAEEAEPFPTEEEEVAREIKPVGIVGAPEDSIIETPTILKVRVMEPEPLERSIQRMFTGWRKAPMPLEWCLQAEVEPTSPGEAEGCRINPLRPPKETGQLLYPARLNGVFCAVLLDSGASHSFLSPDLVRRLALPSLPSSQVMRISTFREAGREMPVERVRVDCVTLGSLIAPWEFLVVPGTTQEALLGLDFIHAFLLHYDPRSHHLIVPVHQNPKSPLPEPVPQAFSSGTLALPGMNESTPDRLRANDAPVLDWTSGFPLSPGSRVVAELIWGEQVVTLCSVTADTLEEIKELAEFRAQLPDDLLLVIDSAPRLFDPPDREPPERSVKHRITLVPDAVPLKQEPYPLAPPKLLALHEQMEKIFQAGWIEPSHSLWGAPVIMVPKKSTEYCMCDDFRDLNAVTVDNSYPLPRLDILLHKAGSSVLFSKIDLASGFH